MLRNYSYSNNGAVYIYTNVGHMNFIQHAMLRLPDPTAGELFGMTLSKVGDIDRDGFNGAFFLFLFHYFYYYSKRFN